MMAAEEEYFIYTGGVVPWNVTRVRIDESVSVITVRAFRGHQNIREVVFHIGVKKVEEFAFYNCPSLRRVIMPGVKVVEEYAFMECIALTDVECGKLEIVGHNAFAHCESLTSVELPSIKIVDRDAFVYCDDLTRISFGKELESIGEGVFTGCTSLERITIPLKDGMITDDDIFQGCTTLKHVDLVEGELYETIAALLLEEWKNNMRREIDAINQILPNAPAGNALAGTDYYVGGKAEAIRVWIGSVLHKIIHYKAEHHRYLKEAANTLELALWKMRLSEINVPEGDEEGRASCRVKCGADIVIKNVLPFLALPSFTFELED